MIKKLLFALLFLSFALPSWAEKKAKVDVVLSAEATAADLETAKNNNPDKIVKVKTLKSENNGKVKETDGDGFWTVEVKSSAYALTVFYDGNTATVIYINAEQVLAESDKAKAVKEESK